MVRKGKFWCCPILYDAESQILAPRYAIFSPLLELILFMHHSMILIADFLNIDIEKGYPLILEKDGNNNRNSEGTNDRQL